MPGHAHEFRYRLLPCNTNGENTAAQIPASTSSPACDRYVCLWRFLLLPVGSNGLMLTCGIETPIQIEDPVHHSRKPPASVLGRACTWR